MQEILDSVLTPLITEDRKEIILECVASLESGGFETALDELHQIIEIQDGISDNAMLLGRIDDVIFTAQSRVFNEHQITVSLESSMAVRSSIVRALANFDTYILPDQLLMLFQGGFTPDEIIANMAAIFSDVDSEDVREVIVEVSVELMRAIEDVVTKNLMVRGVPTTKVAPVSRIRLVNRALDAVGREPLSMITELAAAGVRVGTPIKLLIEQSMTALDRYTPDAAAVQILGLVLFSDVPVDAIQKTTIDLCEDFTDNRMEQVLMTDAVKRLMHQLGALNEAA